MRGNLGSEALCVNVQGLEETVNEAILHAAFIPFGDIKDVNIPLDNTTGKHRGFAFVEFEEREDAETATDNMHNAELYVLFPPSLLRRHTYFILVPRFTSHESET